MRWHEVSRMKYFDRGMTIVLQRKDGGRIALLGIPERATPVNWNLIIFNGLTIKWIYGREMYETWYKMTVMIQGGLDITPVITHRFPADQYAEAFAAARSGQAAKVVLTWSEG